MASKTLEAALRYHRLGWSLIPIRPADKKPACKSWKPYQEQRASEEDLQAWFGNGSDKGLAVVMGQVSGALVCRDFDKMATYERWASEHPELAKTLPTVATGRPGRHVYFRADLDQIRAASPSGGTIIDLGNGELRGGGYCLLPPSKHPSGTDYRWIVELGDELPFIDLETAGLLPCNREDRESAESRENIGGQREQRTLRECPMSTLPSMATAPSLLHDAIELAVVKSLPTGSGQRHKMLFRLARELKGIEGLADAPLAELKPIVSQWHKAALSQIHTKAFEESWFDFAEGWGKVKFPAGEEPIAMLFNQATEAELPEVAKQYEQAELRLLVAFCRELQRACGDGPFYLAGRTAGELLGVDHSTVSRWLRGLQHDGILKLESLGSHAKRKASRYRYLCDL